MAWLAPLAALAALVLAVAGAFLGLGLAAEAAPAEALLGDPYLRRIVLFTMWQAGISTLLAVGFAIPLARALARQDRFFGRTLLLRLFALPPVLPALVAVLGIVALYGANGWLARALAASGLAVRTPLYGLAGILLAHVFFNLPLATRLLLLAWQAIPGESWRLAAQLGLDSRAIFRLLEGPLLRRHAPGLLGLVFLLCVQSFATVLALGGGPAATTLEVAIYQALRFDFAPERAAVLALVQLALCLGLVLSLHSLAAPMAPGATLARAIARPDRARPLVRALDAATILFSTLFVLAPLVAVVLSGLGPALPALLTEPALWRAAALSLEIAVAAGVLATALAAGLLAGARRLRAGGRRQLLGQRLAGPLLAAGLVPFAVPPLVLGAGWFVLLHRAFDPLLLALPLAVAVNALMALPYLLRALEAAQGDLDERYGRLCAALDLAGWRRLRLIDWPLLRRPFGTGFGFALALSLGDLGVIALFGSRDSTTLPLLLYQSLGAYRMDEAQALALLLALLSAGLLALVEQRPAKGG